MMGDAPSIKTLSIKKVILKLKKVPIVLLGACIKKNNANGVYGKRISRQDTKFKKITASFFYRLFNKYSKTKIPEDAGDNIQQIKKSIRKLTRKMKSRDRGNTQGTRRGRGTNSCKKVAQG